MCLLTNPEEIHPDEIHVDSSKKTRELIEGLSSPVQGATQGSWLI